MKKRSPIAVFFLSFLTIFIYSWYWQVKTKGEMNKLGEKIPTAWIWLIPLVGIIWWTWKYSEAVEHVTYNKLNGILAFVLLILLGPIGNAIVQDQFNKIDPSVAAVTGIPVPPVAVQPVESIIPNQSPIVGQQADTMTPIMPITPVQPTSTVITPSGPQPPTIPPTPPTPPTPQPPTFSPPNPPVIGA